jgi:hypothetical protein
MLAQRDALLPLVVEATANLAVLSSGFVPCRVLAYRDSLPPGLVGAYVTLLGKRDSLHVGVLSDDASCIALARRMRANAGETLDGVKVRTSMCDIARSLGEGIGRTIRTRRWVAVSEPVFVDGIARSTRDVGLRAAEVVFGATRATLVLVSRRKHAQNAKTAARASRAGADE